MIQEQREIGRVVLLAQINRCLTLPKTIRDFPRCQPGWALRIGLIHGDAQVMNPDKACAFAGCSFCNHVGIQTQQRAPIQHVTGQQVEPTSLKMVHKRTQ